MVVESLSRLKIKNIKNQIQVNERSSKEPESNKMNEDTFAVDDASKEPKAQNTVNHVS